MRDTFKVAFNRIVCVHFKTLIYLLPKTPWVQILKKKIMDKHDIPFLGDFYTKTEVDAMVAAAVEAARALD